MERAYICLLLIVPTAGELHTDLLSVLAGHLLDSLPLIQNTEMAVSLIIWAL